MLFFTMTFFTLFFLSLQSFEFNCDMMKFVRTDFHEIKTERDLKKYIQRLKVINCEQAEPYLASAIMQKAKYALLPTKQLKNFNEGKNILENYIETHPNDIEAKYVRLLVQRNIPAILGYRKHVNSDLAFVKLNIDNADLPDEYKKVIKNNIEE